MPFFLLDKKRLCIIAEGKSLILDKINEEFILGRAGEKYLILPAAYWKLLEDYSDKMHFGKKVLERIAILTSAKKEFSLRDYQRDLIVQLKRTGYRGVIVLPTGAGKTIVGLELIRRLKVRTLIVVPTIDLMMQWANKIIDMLEADKQFIGFYGGGRKELKEITIATYRSASSMVFLKKAIDFFGLVIFDEAHHLPASSHREIARRLLAPYRIGLTATMPRENDRVQYLEMFIGPIIRGAGVDELVKRKVLADFKIKTIKVKLSRSEKERMKALLSKYIEYIRSNVLVKDRLKAFQIVVKKAIHDPWALEALFSLKKARRIALLPREKIFVLERILKKHKYDKVLIFTRSSSTACLISYLFGIPNITHKTPPDVRYQLLRMLKNGELSKIVSSKVLEEGIDIPDIGVVIIVSGTASDREMIQRIGRALRFKTRKAIIYELITKTKYEKRISKKRKKGIFEIEYKNN